jgi:hypothetical protein
VTTTLRLDEKLYREAKAEAARQGMTITRFIEEALRSRLRQARSPRRAEEIELPTFAAGAGFRFSPQALKELERRTQAEHDRTRLARSRRGRR